METSTALPTTPPITVKGPPSTSDNVAEVTRLTKCLIALLNSHDFSYTDPNGREINSHISPDFEGRFHGHPFAINWEQQTDLWRQMVSNHPEIRFDVVDLNVSVRRRSQTASVFLSMAITGVGAVVFNGVCELDWRRVGERWLLQRHVVMRGPLLDGSM